MGATSASLLSKAEEEAVYSDSLFFRLGWSFSTENLFDSVLP